MAARSRRVALTAQEAGFIAHALTLAPRVLKSATRDLNRRHGLGPHGAWILRLIGNGQVVYPLDVTRYFLIGRSLISDELARLKRAQLIGYRRSAIDGRRVELTLTPLGRTVMRQIRAALTRLVASRLAGHSKADVLRFASVLQAFVLEA